MKTFTIRMKDADIVRIKAEAASNYMSISNYVRGCCLSNQENNTVMREEIDDIKERLSNLEMMAQI